MACYSPLSAYQLDSGEITFSERGAIKRDLTLPCGQCIGCRLERSRQWAIRCVHESQLYDYNSFVTLTYDDAHLASDYSLHYPDYQLFMRRLRKHFSGVRFYMCGEYGENFQRPHFHACLFNCFFADRSILSTTSAGSSLYRSPLLERLWPHGFSSIGDVTFESAAYVARYIVKKVTGSQADSHYTFLDPDTGELIRRTPEFTQMSRKPGIGARWFARYRSDVYEHDYVVIRGSKVKPPRYYDNLLKSASDFSSDHVEFLRSQKALARGPRDTPERLAVRQAVAIARLATLTRKL